MQHRHENGTENGVANGLSHDGVDDEAGKVAATAAKQVVHGLRATAAAFTPSKQMPAATSSTASVGGCSS